eukprot:3384992-Lingulodinium_polyedra.AAC.1
MGRSSDAGSWGWQQEGNAGSYHNSSWGRRWQTRRGQGGGRRSRSRSSQPRGPSDGMPNSQSLIDLVQST